MNSLGRTLLIILFLAAVMLASCSSRQSTPTVSDAEIMETAISTVSTDFAETQRAIPTNMPLPTVIPTRTPTSPPKPSPTSTSVFTDPSIPLSERIVYYYLVGQRENPIPEGAVRAVSFNAGAVFHVAGLVAPTYADETYTSDTAADLRTALEIVLHDERNSWGGPDFEPEIVDVTFRFGHAKVRLQNEYSIGEPSSSRDVYAPVVGTRMLILLTVFANPAVQTATVWFNEDTIANLAIYDSRQAKPADYVFTRAEMETYLKEQEYVTPTPIPTSTPIMFIDPSLPPPEILPNAIDLQWITAYGLPGDQIGTKIHPTKDGGFILVGNTVVGQLRGPSWLLKLRADGFIEWQKSLPQVRALDVLETSAGDFILAGDLHWIKLDSQGNILWQYTFGGFSYHTPPILRLVEESNGNIVVEAVGSRTVFNAEGELQSFTEYTMNWDSQTYPANIRDRSGETLWAGGEKNSLRYWVGKADLNDGWLKGLSSSEYDIGPMLFIQTTADGGVIVGVPGYENVDPIGYFSYVLISLFSGDGSVRWQKIYHSDSVASHEDFHAFETKSGDFIVAGTFVDFQGGGDVWISRLDRDGNIRWMKLYRTEGKDAVAFIQELSNGDLIFAGRTSGAGTGAQDMWILKTNAQGEIPNCGHARNIRASWSRARGVSSEVETIALGGISLIEREVIPIFEDEPRPFGDADARVIPLCLPSP